MDAADELRAWFDATELGQTLVGYSTNANVPVALVRRIAYGAAMLAYEKGVIDGARLTKERFSDALFNR